MLRPLRLLPMIVLVLAAGGARMAPPAVLPVDAAEPSPYRWLYDDLARFEELSGSARARLERRYGPHTGIPSGTDLLLPAAQTSALPNPLVNDPAQDAGAQDTQSQSALVLGANQTVIAAFNDSGSAINGENKFTGLARSTDGGSSFVDTGTLPSSIDGDGGSPVLARDSTTSGVYLVTLPFGTTAAHKLQFFRSFDNGATWSPPVNSAPGFVQGADSHDKPWIAVDNAGGSCQGNVYQAWRNASADPARNGITFIRSTDGGATWSPDQVVFLAPGGQGTSVTVGPDHSVYVFWYDSTVSPRRIAMRRSADCGVTFASTTTVASLAGSGANGNLGLEFRTNSFPHALVNPLFNDLYVVYNDAGGAGDRADIFFRHSIDRGASWSSAIRLNDDAGTSDQFFPALAVRPDGSALFVPYYSRQLDPANSLIDRWGRIATITGHNVTFSPSFRISSESFPPVVGVDPLVQSDYMGGNDMAAADNTSFYCVWGDNRDRNLANTRNQANVRFAKIPAGGPGAILSLGAVTAGGGNGNGALDPNECATLTISLANLGSSPATGISATLSSNTAGVSVTQASSAYPDIAAGQAAANSTPFRISLPIGLVCGSRIELLLTVSTTSGTFSVPVQLSVGGAGPGATFDATTPQAVPDNGTLNATQAVSGISGPIGKVTVALQIQHTSDADLDISLIGPDGATVELSTDNGTIDDYYGLDCTRRTIFDDSAARAITAGLPPFEGAFRPEQPLALFNGKSGPAVNGTWTLRVSDDLLNSDTGALMCWSITISALSCTDGGGACAAAGAPSITSVEPSSGPETGGTAVTIRGAAFVSGAGVTFGGAAATNVVVVDAATITATTPAHAPGAVDVAVTNPDSQVATLAGGFQYGAAAGAMLVSGTAMLNGGPAPNGAVIRAFIAGTQCGSGTSSGAAGANFSFQVSPAAQTAGCGTPGAIVSFTIAGVAATPTATFVSGPVTLNLSAKGSAGPLPTPVPTPSPTPGPTASPSPTPAGTPPPTAPPCVPKPFPGCAAATPAPTPTPPGPTPTAAPTPTPTPPPGLAPMTVQGSITMAGGPAPAGLVVQALIGDTVCGSGLTAPGGAFSLSVASTNQTTGCGTPGATVRYRVNGAFAGTGSVFVSGGSTVVVIKSS